MQYASSDELLSFASADQQADRFEEILAKYGVETANGSMLEHGLLLLHEMHSRYRNPTNDPWANLNLDLQEALGVLHIVQLVVRNEAKPDFAETVPHLKLLNTGHPAQTKPTSVTDADSNKLFELAIGLGVIEVGRDLRMDDPQNSSGGRNPDILARMPDDQLWGIACKVLHSDNPKTLFERISDGFEQIERSPADCGIVVVSFKNILPHQKLLPNLSTGSSGTPVLGVHHDVNDVVAQLSRFADDRVEAMLTAVGREEIWGAIRSKKAVPGILLHLMTGVGIETQLGPTPTVIGFLRPCQMEYSPLVLPSRFTATVKATLEAVNYGLRVAP